MINSGSKSSELFSKYLKSINDKEKVKVTKKVLDKNVEYLGKNFKLRDLVYLLIDEGMNVYYTLGVSKTNYFIGVDGDSVLDINVTVFEFAKSIINGNMFKGNIVNYTKFIEEREKSFADWGFELSKLSLYEVMVSDQNFGSFENLINYLKGYYKEPKNYFKVFVAYNKESKELDLFEAQDFNRLNSSNFIKLSTTTDSFMKLLEDSSSEIRTEFNENIVVQSVNNIYQSELYELIDFMSENKAKG